MKILPLLGALVVVGFPLAAQEPPNPGAQKVLGIGGFFFRARDPAALARWYEKHLSIALAPTSYDARPWQQEAGITIFAPFPDSTDYFGSRDRAWMINFRVPDLAAMVEQLRADGIAVTVDSTLYPNGRFARLHDPEGNPIELWEPRVAGAQSSPGGATTSESLARARRELGARYAENEAGFFARDVDRVMRLRHPGFHTITPDGTVSSRDQMYERTRAFIARIERFDSLAETITALTLSGDTAHAVVLQRTARQQRFADGQLHEVRTWVVQRESWIRTAQGWLFWRVDEIQPGMTLVDGRMMP
jgi:predicted enzyme related to lactoylglutathione lyase